MTYRILGLPAVIDRLSKSRSAIYDDIAKGTFPRPISLGGRRVGWSESEIDAIIRARIAGKTEDEVRQLVIDLQDGRKAVA
jgi:prophage regulatory protein